MPVQRGTGKKGPSVSPPPLDHATIGYPGDILVQQSADPRPEGTRQVDPCTTGVAEHIDKDFSDRAGILDRAVLWARDILKCVREDFVPRLFAREGCEEDCGGEDNPGYPPVSALEYEYHDTVVLGNTILPLTNSYTLSE